MKKLNALLALLGLLLLLFAPHGIGLAYNTADSFQLPLDGSWDITQKFGNERSLGRFHVGEDVQRDSEVAVYAIGNGIVKHNSQRTDYGYVLVIEHKLPNGSYVSSVYGHMRAQGRATIEKEASKGELIGYLSSDPAENGGYDFTHIHFGIRSGNYSAETDTDGKWRYRGYAPADIKALWRNPLAFINAVHENKYIWEFKYGDGVDGDTEGWQPYNIESYSVNKQDPNRDGVFYIDPAASDPWIQNRNVLFRADDYDTLQIMMASNAPDTTGAIYFVTSGSPEWGEDKKVPFTVTNDGEYRIYPVFMAGDSQWASTITGIRIDPANNGIAGSNEDTIGFDYVRLVKTSPPSGRVTLDLDTKYWEHGSYQLRITAQASPGEVSSITISGPCVDTATYSYSGGERIFILGTKEPPRIGQSITFYIRYQDDSSETISKTIDGVFTETPVLVSPPDGSTVNTLTPTFQWRNLSISGLIYSVQIEDTGHNRVYDVYDLPDGTTSHTIQKPITRGATYLWLVSASDNNGNEALADWDKLRISSVAGLGYHKVTQVIDTINQGAETVFNYIISQTKDLIFGLGWEGSTLKLSVHRPDGSLYAEEENSTSPITITIPKAEAGEWRYKITGIDVPYDDYPFVVEIGQRPPVASDLQNLIVYPNPCRLTDGNPTITFKGLTADAIIRILGIDGQLINQTELIGQVNWTWNVKNQTNEDLTRGIYIYLITNSAGQKKIGKIAIIK